MSTKDAKASKGKDPQSLSEQKKSHQDNSDHPDQHQSPQQSPQHQHTSQQPNPPSRTPTSHPSVKSPNKKSSKPTSTPSTPSATKKNDPKPSQKPPPSIEQYNNLKDQLTQQILHKQQLDAQLSQLESSIYDRETEYFNESIYGNIVKGFENFSKNSGGAISGGGGSGGGGGGHGGSGKRRITYTDEDHVFSLSSVSFIKTLLKRQGVSDSTLLNALTNNSTAASGAAGHQSSNTAASSSSGGSAALNGVGKDDFDDYEDSVDPAMGGGPNNNFPSAIESSPGVNGGSAASTPGMPGRKRKARVLDD